MMTKVFAKLSTQGRIVLPKQVRQELQLKPGTEFEVEIFEGKIILQPVLKKENLQKTLANLREIVRGLNLREELKAERQQQKVREHKLQKN